ncbi:MAG: YARHG domain-containing protein [Bacteroidota bacterium]|nr:YARHG domain-containing protein [Bacteroidota bacterium]
MKNKLILLLSILINLTSFANDGVFYASGNNLIPLQETSISLKKELLIFKIRNFNQLLVEVNFEFYNPGKEKKLLVGFVSPPASGDISELEEKHPQIENFTVLVNGDKLTYKVKRFDETSFKTDVGINAKDFIYFFEVNFKSGLNKVKHTYSYKASNSVEAYREFEYQITTGKRWANKRIDDFELQIHLDNGIFFVPESFSKSYTKINWKIKGSGTFKEGTEKPFFDHGAIPYRYVHLNYGYIYFKEVNFAPDYDIYFGENAWHSYTYKWCNKADSCSKNELLQKMAPYFKLKPETYNNYRIDLNSFELKLLKNYFYAVRGLKFKTEDITNFYSSFFWYNPITELKAESIKLSNNEKKFVTYLVKMEKEMQAKEN